MNFGCTPTKTAIASVRVAHLARRAAEFGLHIPEVEVDFPAVLRRAKNIALESRIGLEKDLKETGNPKLIRGHARIVGRDEAGLFQIQIKDVVLTTKQIILDTGTRSVIPKIDGFQLKSGSPEYIQIAGEFQFHIGSIKNRRLRCRRNPLSLVSIPHWFN